MTIKELKEALNKFDENLEVFLHDDENDSLYLVEDYDVKEIRIGKTSRWSYRIVRANDENLRNKCQAAVIGYLL